MSDPWSRSRGTCEDSPLRARREEMRLYGVNAVRALFERRPEALRKLYLSDARAGRFGDVMKWCAANRVGYRVVPDDDLRKLAGSSHHEGVVADVLRTPPSALADWLRGLPAGPACAIWLDGVGNPHNLGAILRSAAHFGVAGLLVPDSGELQLSGAAARVAEGGAESVAMVQAGAAAKTLDALRAAGFVPVATLVEGGSDPFSMPLPDRLVYVMGAERSGMDRRLADACDLRVSIAGTGAVESLNVAAATAVLLAAWSARRSAS